MTNDQILKSLSELLAAQGHAEDCDDLCAADELDVQIERNLLELGVMIPTDAIDGICHSDCDPQAHVVFDNGTSVMIDYAYPTAVVGPRV